MDRSLVQAKTSRSRSAPASDIGNRIIRLATRRILRAACMRHGFPRLRRAGKADPRSGSDRMSFRESPRLASAGSFGRPTARAAEAVRPSAIASSTNRPTSNVVKRSIYR